MTREAIEQIYSYRSFLKNEKDKIREKIKNEYRREYENSPQEQEISWRAYSTSEEYAKVMQEKLNANEQFLLITNELQKGKNDQFDETCYGKYCERVEKMLADALINSKRENSKNARSTDDRENSLDRKKFDSLIKYSFAIWAPMCKKEILGIVREFIMTYDFGSLKLTKEGIEKYGLEYSILRSLDRAGSVGRQDRSLIGHAVQHCKGMTLLEYGKRSFVRFDKSMQKLRYREKGRFDRHFREEFLHLILKIKDDSIDIFWDNIDKNKSFLVIEARIVEQQRFVENKILDTIPDRMPDLYPLARQMRRHFILHVGPTNSGKTYLALEALKKAKKGIYLAPLRLLAYEIYDRLNEAGVSCNMITGEEEIILEGAHHYSATIESVNILDKYDTAVIDEGQMIGDITRGGAWTKAILGLCAKEIHVCSDDSCVDIVTRIIEECGDTYEIVKHERNVPLVRDSENFIFPQMVHEKDALIVFSKRSVLAVAAKLQQEGVPTSIIYGNLPYDVRMNEVRRFIEGETKVVVATDAIGMGLNLPIKRIVFLELKKFDGKTVRKLNETEIKQIAGRAGRRGQFDIGYYTAEFNEKYVESCVAKKLPKITKARISIPESIIYIDSPLSEIMRRWAEIQDEGIYEKVDLVEDLNFCVSLEKIVKNKELLYDFITIAFNKERASLKNMLTEFADNEANGGEDKEAELNRIIDSYMETDDEYLDAMQMDDLESLYARYDLMYAYLRKFGHRERLCEVVELKRDCSRRIIDMLKDKQLDTKKCTICGTELAWNYPYTKCANCYKAHLY